MFMCKKETSLKPVLYNTFHEILFFIVPQSMFYFYDFYCEMNK